MASHDKLRSNSKEWVGILVLLFHVKEVTVGLALVKWFMMNKISPYNMSKSHFCHSFTPAQFSQIVITPVQNGSRSGLFFKRLKGNNKSITCAEELRAKSGITIYLTSCRFETNQNSVGRNRIWVVCMSPTDFFW